MTKYTCGPINDQREVNIELPAKPTSIGIMLSGGADSSMLLYLLCKENEKLGNIHHIIPFTVAKIDGAAYWASSILQYFYNNFGIKLQQPRLVGNPMDFHDKQVASGIADALKSRFCDVLFVGENQNPPEEFPMKGMYPLRLKTNPYPETVVQFPFLHLYKTHIIDLYSQFGIQRLAAATHTCTAKTVGRCMECFACDERRWAYEQLNEVDVDDSDK